MGAVNVFNGKRTDDHFQIKPKKIISNSTK